MIGNIAELATSSDIYDLCVVGGGAAGLTLARRVAEAMPGARVVLLEGGGPKQSAKSQNLYKGEVVGIGRHPAPDTYRVRAIGGTSAIWGGRCIPFDPIDFGARDWVPNSGWPIDGRSLEQHYADAQEIAEAGVFDFALASSLKGQQQDLVPGLVSELIETTIERFSRPTNFWRRHGEALTRSTNAHVAMNASVVRIALSPDGRSVDHLVVKGEENRELAVRAAYYVLAAGGLETTRLLLASNDVRPAGVGNEHDQLGRNYMSHLATSVSVATFKGPPAGIGHDYARDSEGVYVRRRFALTERAQRDGRLLNTTFRTYLPDPGDPAHGNAVLSAMFLAKRLVQREYSAKFSEKDRPPADYVRHALNMAIQPLTLSRFAADWMRRRVFADRKLPSVVLEAKDNSYTIEFHAEQAPNPESRLTLGHGVDALGMRQLKIDWRLTELDFESVRGAHAVLGAEMARTGTGVLVCDAEHIEARILEHGFVGGHHIGTTRMAARAEDGVVDKDLRVHSVGNLYVAGSSVFPTSGQANPTLTILALTLRLADHLCARLRHQKRPIETAA